MPAEPVGELVRGAVPYVPVEDEVVGVVGRAYAGRLSVEGEFAGFSFGDRGSVYEFDSGAHFHLSDRLAVQAGYRVVSAKPKDGSNLVNFRLGGWHFGVELSL